MKKCVYLKFVHFYSLVSLSPCTLSLMNNNPFFRLKTQDNNDKKLESMLHARAAVKLLYSTSEQACALCECFSMCKVVS